jgi:hypothetical protein
LVQIIMKHFPRKLAAALALAALSFGACKARDQSSRREAELAAAPTAAVDEMKADGYFAEAADGQPSGGLVAKQVVDNRKIIRTGSIDVVVEAYEDARAKIDAMVKAAGGFVDSTRVSHSEGRVSNAQIVVRIPASQFADLLPKLRELGEVRSENTDSADITAEYVDLSARRDAAAALEKRLIELAANRTGTVADVLEVERELARVRAEIEQYEGQIRMWDDQVTLSTLTLSLSTTQPEIAAPAPPGFRHDASSAFDQSMGAMKDAGKGLLLALISILPWLPLFIPGFLIGRRYVRRWRAALPRAIAYAYPVPMPPPAPPVPVPAGDGDQRPQPAPSPP